MPLPEYAIALGDVYAVMGEKVKAEEQYDLVRSMDKLLRANGVDTDLEIALFNADHDIDLQRSLEKARAAYDARPSIHAADTMAWTLYKTGNYKEAQEYSSEALKLGTRDPLKLFHAGMISKALGDKEQARTYLQQAIDLNPHFSLLYADEAADSLKTSKAGGRLMARWGWLLACLAFAVFASLIPREAQAHPLGNFTINHYSSLAFAEETARITYILDFAEIPTLQQKARLDANGDGKLSDEEANAYLDAEMPSSWKVCGCVRETRSCRWRYSIARRSTVPVRGASDPASAGSSTGRPSERLER